MPWSLDNVPNPAKNKSVELQKVCILAANSALERTGDEESAIFACIGAMKAHENKGKTEVKKHVIPERKKEALEKAALDNKAKISPAFLPPNSIPADPDRSLVSAEFNDKNQLVLTFDDGKQIKTKPVETVLNIEQNIAFKKVIESSSGTPADIAVRFVSTPTTTITDADDILICTTECTVTLPLTSVKTFRIKRYGTGNVTYQAQAGQLVELEAFRVLNINLYSVDIHQAPDNNWVEL